MLSQHGSLTAQTAANVKATGQRRGRGMRREVGWRGWRLGRSSGRRDELPEEGGQLLGCGEALDSRGLSGCRSAGSVGRKKCDGEVVELKEVVRRGLEEAVQSGRSKDGVWHCHQQSVRFLRR